MKEKIHPNYGKAIVRCVCGETFETGSTKKELRVDICSKCHPFYTGKQKLVDSGGRVDRFIAELWRAHRLSQIGHTSDLFSLYRIRERRTHEYF